jgi:hypothetical protein
VEKLPGEGGELARLRILSDEEKIATGVGGC